MKHCDCEEASVNHICTNRVLVIRFLRAGIGEVWGGGSVRQVATWKIQVILDALAQIMSLGTRAQPPPIRDWSNLQAPGRGIGVVRVGAQRLKLDAQHGRSGRILHPRLVHIEVRRRPERQAKRNHSGVLKHNESFRDHVHKCE